MSKINKAFKFYNGKTIPSIGLGTWESDKAEEAVLSAIKAGYKHIDCAAIYKVGRAIKNSGIKREELFITSKLWCTEFKPEKVEKACRKTISDLQLEYLDLYLMHWPIGVDSESTKERPHLHINILDTWKEMEKLVDLGLVKSIGVSNFNAKKLSELLNVARVKPAVNQVELHPYLRQENLLNFAKENDIHLTAYCPLARNKDPHLLKDDIITKIAKKHNKEPSQVVLSWAVQRGTSAIPKSENEGRIKENLEIFELDENDMNEINQISITSRCCPSDWLGANIFDPNWK